MEPAVSAPALARPQPQNDRGVLVTLANCVRRLVPYHRDPERYHIEKDAIERELRQLVRAWDPR